MFDIEREAQKTLVRLLPRIEPLLDGPGDYQNFILRLNQYFPTIFRLLHQLYGNHYDFFYHLEQIIQTAARSYQDRPADLRELDAKRENNPYWFKSNEMVGAVIYVDLFAGTLQGVHDKIDYFKELGVTYLHLMPIFKAPERNNDGGYAVSDFRKVSASLGTMEQLRDLAKALRTENISLVVDFVFNHTSDEHEWALKVLDGDENYRNFYYIFPDRTLPDQYEKNLREIFPDSSPGNFTYRDEIKSWVWTTFNSFQWDLNYANPETLNAMLGEMLFLANQGVEILRLDAVAFIWKQLGTSCENLPQAHIIIRAMNALSRLAAPAMIFKSEAIVHPDDVVSYISPEEAPISYNPTFMATLWEALATREVKLLRHSMALRFALPEGCTWVNYIRVHDDIGWSFADEDASYVWINGYNHRQFLNNFFTGKFPGSFATGLPFGYNPQNNDMRICGTTASLCGLEAGLNLAQEGLIYESTQRILMLYSIIIAAGGIPLIYIGDEIATVNDYRYLQDPNKAEDNRWVHRPKFDWERAERRTQPQTIEGHVFSTIKHLIEIRKANPVFGDEQTLFFDTLNPHVLGFVRNRELLVLANFSEREQTVDCEVVRAYWLGAKHVKDLINSRTFPFNDQINLGKYEYLWLIVE